MSEQHLSDENLTELLLGTPEEAVAAHVAGCEACRAELARLSAAVSRASEWTRAAAERPAGFWYTQRQAILEGVSARPQRSHLTAWASVLAALVLTAVLLGRVSVEPNLMTGNGGNSVDSAAAPVDPDDELMAEIQASVRRPVPRAFEPALLVTQELHRAAEANQ